MLKAALKYAATEDPGYPLDVDGFAFISKA